MKFHEHTAGEFRVVGFEVEPRSVKWSELKTEASGICAAKSGQWDSLPPLQLQDGKSPLRRIVEIVKILYSCVRDKRPLG